MSVLNYRSLEKSNLRNAALIADTNHQVRVRVKLLIPPQSQQTTILPCLTDDFGLSVFCTVLALNQRPKQLDLELRGTIAQVTDGLSYLESINVVIKGKPNPDGDSWYY